VRRSFIPSPESSARMREVALRAGSHRAPRAAGFASSPRSAVADRGHDGWTARAPRRRSMLPPPYLVSSKNTINQEIAVPSSSRAPRFMALARQKIILFNSPQHPYHRPKCRRHHEIFLWRREALQLSRSERNSRSLPHSSAAESGAANPVLLTIATVRIMDGPNTAMPAVHF